MKTFARCKNYAGAFYFGAFAARFKSLRQIKIRENISKRRKKNTKKMIIIRKVSLQMLCKPKKNMIASLEFCTFSKTLLFIKNFYYLFENEIK